jgi:uncharacterized protein (DUF4415 family)
MKTVYRREPGTPLTAQPRERVRALAAMPDSAIQYAAMPRVPDEARKNAVRRRLYRPAKQAVSLRLDADVIAWLKKDGDGYQTRANQMLRERMLQDLAGK